MAEATKRNGQTPAAPPATGGPSDAAGVHAAEVGGRTGLRVSRFFTTPGAHPYDDLEWELRDAVIKNWRDGTVSFEQRGVEFPSTWSMNATTIVAQKYFRGPLGSPERERSVKQMVDRVADTITGWGRADGYFADDESAETFNLELKHLLVNQKMAFNSPVWFNVGVEEQPQCSACQPWDALVSTPTGFVPIGRIVDEGLVGLEVNDSSGTTRVVAVEDNGVKRVFRVRLENGSFVEATADHVVRAVDERGGEPRWLRVDELQPGMRMHLQPHRASITGARIDDREVSEAALAGWLQAGGSVGRYDGTDRSLTVEFVVAGNDEHRWIKRHLDEVFPHAHREERPVDGRPDVTRIRLHGEALHGFVERWGLVGRRDDLRVPQRLFTAPVEVVQAYLRSVWQSEGDVAVEGGSARIGIAVTSERWTEDLQLLLLRLGIYSRRYRAVGQRDDRSGTWHVDVSYRSEREAFARRVGFVGWDEQDALSASLELPGGACPDLREEAIVGIVDVGEQRVYDIQTESGEYLSNSIVVHNCFILSVEDTMGSILNWYREEGLIFKGGSGAGVNLSSIRSSKEQLRGGGEASGPVSFMRGADASAGTIKCLHEDTPVVTDRGVVPIRDVRAGDRVATRFGMWPVEAVHDNGVRPLVRVTTALGDEILCTPEHRFWVRGSDGEGWREAKDLRPDDHLVIDLATTGYGERQRLLPIEQGHHGEAEHHLPEFLDEAFALWLGWVFGDGSVTARPSADFVAVQVGDADPELADRYRTLTRSVFGDSIHLYGSRHDDRDDASTSLRFASTQVVRSLERNGLRERSAADVRVPALVASSPATVRASFLAGLFEADGHVGNGYPWLSTVSLAFARDVHRLLLSIGIPSTISRIDDRRAAWGEAPVHTVRVVSGEGVRRFAKLVGFVSERKSRSLEHAVAREDASRLRARAGVERSPALAASSIASSVEGDRFYTTATVTPASEGPTFDLTVGDVHEYLVNSVVTHNSGGKTRRAAKMVILNVDHPDVEEFIWCKAREENKIRVLREAGFDMDLDSPDYASIQYQNANNSVRVTDEFMEAWGRDGEFDLRAVTTGETVEPRSARDIMRQIAQAAWECADPGMQYDTTINRWHTCPESGRINGSNPCFTADTLVHTDKGLIRFDELLYRVSCGETFGVYTHDATNPQEPAERMVVTTPDAFMVTGTNEIVELTFSNGMRLRCTPGHRIWTANRGYVEAEDLGADDAVKTLNLPTPAVHADRALPVPADPAAYHQTGNHTASVRLPEKWSEELGHYLGWLVGDGSVSGNVVSTIYGSEDDRAHVLPQHLRLVTWMNGGRAPKPSVQRNGTVQLRQSRRAIVRFLEALGITDANAPDKRVPPSVFQAPPEVVAAFLRGLFDADGCAFDSSHGTRGVALGSASEELLRDVQLLLSTFGIVSRIYRGHGRSERGSFSYTRKDGSTATYGRSGSFQLRIAGTSVGRFADAIGFTLPVKHEVLETILTEHSQRETDSTTRLVSRRSVGFQTTFNLSEPRNHSYVANGVVVRNCSEYMHLDNSACNLASLNLKRFYDYEADRFDVEAYERAVDITITAQEIIVGNSSYPTERIAENAVAFRELGLGYANLGGLLMSLGMPYDSDEGRAWCAALTALMTGRAYRTSAEIAKVTGPFAGYPKNASAMLNVIDMHRQDAERIDPRPVPDDLLAAAKRSWQEAYEIGSEHGFRNSQASVIAPTGCLVGGTLVPTDRGLVRLTSLGDPAGSQWQDLSVDVMTDEGPREATRFYVNGLESVVTVTTARGYRIQGTPRHRVKVVTPDGRWEWKRFADIAAGDRVPLALDQLVGEPQEVALPPLAEAYWTGEHHARAPRRMTPELAELIGYFMGDGSLHARGIRLCVAPGDVDVVERLTLLGKELFHLEAHVQETGGYTEVAFHSVRLVEWWEACGLAKREPRPGHRGKGWTPHVPDAVLHSNDRQVYAAFLRGLFEADGTVTMGYPTWSTTSFDFSHDVQTLLLALGYPTTRKVDRSGWGDSEVASLRLLNSGYNEHWLDEVGFIGDRKNAAVALTEVAEATGDREVAHLLGFFYDEVASAELGEEELTYDLSVPDNVTYVANGFVSHNTISFLMDCDTTGIEPDLGLVKTKKLVGGGSMSIVNQTVPQALRRLGYNEEQVEAIVAHIDEHKTLDGAPAIREEHRKVFQCAMGDDAIHYMGHVRMMAAAQPFVSGAISKCVVGETLVATEDGLVRIGSLHDGERADSFRDHVVEVASLDGTQKTDAFYYGGVRPVREVVLRSGHRVVGTPNHRLLVATAGGLQWKMLHDIEPGDHVATQYGSEMWSTVPARFDDFAPSPRYGSQKAVTVPAEMTEELAFLLGAYAAEGHTTRSAWTVTITNAEEEVLERVAAAWRSEFGVEPRVDRPAERCPAVVVSSQTVVEFLDHLGVGERASAKRIPDAVLRSPRAMVLAFLQGLALGAHTARMGRSPKWAIRVDSPGLLDDLQAILTNLGVVHGRVSKRNAEDGRAYDEVYAAGRAVQDLVRLVPFVEPHERHRAEALLEVEPRQSTADVVPGIGPREVYDLLPYGQRNADGIPVRTEFAFLVDERTQRVSRRTLERVAAVPGVELPDWLETVLRDGLHFSPVARVEDAGDREVFDLSVPTTHAFVGNGVVNHNTVNMPEEATVEDVEQLFYDGWTLGLKAIAIYRDNCKVAQPLSVTKKEGAQAPGQTGEVEVKQGMVRRKLPKQRPSQTISFRVADAEGYLTAGEYPGDGLGEIFVKLGKQGSTLSGVMDAFAISVSLGLQYGVPLDAYVSKFMNMRFEPAGMTDDDEIRFATSIVDYLARKLAIEYLPAEKRAELGVFTTDERTTALDVQYGGEAQPRGAEAAAPPPADQPSSLPTTALGTSSMPADADAPLCFTCGIKMKRAGSCHVCEQCGTTSGCS